MHTFANLNCQPRKEDKIFLEVAISITSEYIGLRMLVFTSAVDVDASACNSY
jgi:hypothetical protein